MRYHRRPAFGCCGFSITLPSSFARTAWPKRPLTSEKQYSLDAHVGRLPAHVDDRLQPYGARIDPFLDAMNCSHYGLAIADSPFDHSHVLVVGELLRRARSKVHQAWHVDQLPAEESCATVDQVLDVVRVRITLTVSSLLSLDTVCLRGVLPMLRLPRRPFVAPEPLLQFRYDDALNNA